MMEKADPAQKLYNRMRLWEFPHQYLVEPSDGSSAPFLAISRFDGSVNFTDNVPQFSPVRAPQIWTIFGVVGMLKLLAGSYLLVITERECVGSYLGYPFFKIISMKVFPCDLSLKNAPEEQIKMESKFSHLLNIAEGTPGLYFSYDVNITLSAQRLHDLGDESKLLPLWRQADPRFLWNNYMLEVLIDNKLDPYLLPVMQGSFQSFQSAIGKDIFDVTLIARRCTRRTGTRMWRRGADSDGFVANFVETEQIMQLNGFTASFIQVLSKDRDLPSIELLWDSGEVEYGTWWKLESSLFNYSDCNRLYFTIRVLNVEANHAYIPTATFGSKILARKMFASLQMINFVLYFMVRGSIPLIWDQIVDLTYKPKFEIMRLEEIPQVVERHFLDLRKKYGNIHVVDLVDKHGGEGRLSEKFGSAMQQIAGEDVRYLHFDFHRICGDLDIKWLSILYHQIETFLFRNRYLLLNEKGEKVERQVGVVRINCIDCLDRTNVTQSLIARKMLESQLRRLGVFNADETISTHPNFDQSFKILWANHGDDISIQYAGTPALKGDFVRCGRRTIQGILKDSWNALERYYLNNFCDGTKQDAIDLLQGHYIVAISKTMTPTAKDGGVEAIASFRLAFLLIMTGLVFATMSLRRVRYNMWNLLFSVMWASMSFFIASIVKANGRFFCNRPRLHRPRC